MRQGTLSAAAAGAVQRDAATLLGWMARQLERRPYPMAAVGAAIVLAAEMNTVSWSGWQAGCVEGRFAEEG